MAFWTGWLVFAIEILEWKTATSIYVAIVGREKTIARVIEERSHEIMYKTDKKKLSKDIM